MNNCKNCGKLITRGSKLGRCKKCSHLGNLAYNFKGGKQNRKKYCIVCHKILNENAYYKETKRCRSCELKKRWKQKLLKPRFGKSASRYKDGRSLNKYFCIDCGKELKHYKSKRCRLCFHKGKLHPHWKDGLSLSKYTSNFSNKLKEQIRQRDKFTCQKCYITEIKSVKKFQRKLHIHHIDYDKTNCNKNNLITLCVKCNSKVNFNRDYWYAYFRYIMELK
jgi:hypothetical protein